SKPEGIPNSEITPSRQSIPGKVRIRFRPFFRVSEFELRIFQLPRGVIRSASVSETEGLGAKPGEAAMEKSESRNPKSERLQQRTNTLLVTSVECEGPMRGARPFPHSTPDTRHFL